MELLFSINCVYVLLILVVFIQLLIILHVQETTNDFIIEYLKNYDSKYTFISKMKITFWKDIRKALLGTSLYYLRCKVVLLINFEEDIIENILLTSVIENKHIFQLSEKYQGEFEFVGFEYKDDVIPSITIYIKNNESKEEDIYYRNKEINLPIGLLSFYY